MLTDKERTAFHRNATLDGKPISAKERETLIKRFLPSTPSSDSPTISPYPSRKPSQTPPYQRRKPVRRKPIRTFVWTRIHQLLHVVTLALFGLYIRLRQTYHAVVDRVLAVLFYHHRTPDWIRRDIQGLNKIPEHLSVILSLDEERLQPSGLESLLNDVGDLAAWCASAGVSMISIYERKGILKRCIPQTYQRIRGTLHSYFGDTPYAPCPTISVRAPSEPSYSPPTTPPTLDTEIDSQRHHLTVLLISEDDGRDNLVDLTKTLAVMAQQQKISPNDISAELVDAEISESIMSEPDLLILFGPRVMLEGYPPWQVRLTEIFHVPDNAGGVSYQVFLRALHKYAKAQMRFGR